MVSDRIYDLCRPILEDEALGEEDKTDKLEDLLSGAPTSLKGKALEDAVLGALWQWKGATDGTIRSSPPPARGATVIRSRSPAPWMQRAGTPGSVSSSPRPSPSALAHPPPGFGPPAFARTKSSTASPFGSPRPSPRLPVATPIIPHSPRLSAYQFSESSPTTENYGDYGSDTVDWLVNDDTSSNTSYGDSGFASSADFMSPYTTEMSPYDMLRSILQDSRTDDELEQVLEANGYDLSQTINSLMEGQSDFGDSSVHDHSQQPPAAATYLVGKSMSPTSRPLTPAGMQKSPIVCRYWLASGHCARADCRFAHEVQNHVCKYWLQGNCLAGQNCLFSHDPATLMQQMNLNSGTGSPQQQAPNLQLSDYDSFPALQPTTSNPYEDVTTVDPNVLNAMLARHPSNQQYQQGGSGAFPMFVPTGPRLGSHSSSRPGSRHASRAPTPSQQPNFQDDEAFPTLGSAAAAAKPGKRHHGKRGGHNHNSYIPSGTSTSAASTIPVQASNLADIVRLSPSPSPTVGATPAASSRDALRRGLRNNRSFTSTTPVAVAGPTTTPSAASIPAPQSIPWLETGPDANAAYTRARAEAFKHGGLRNKFLQSAAQAWNRNDARGAKALSLRGQNENALMREKHREAARALWEERNRGLAGTASDKRELYLDLHGLHPEEAVAYLEDCLREAKLKSRLTRTDDGPGGVRPIYAICGTGHHSKNGRDKVGKAVRAWLTDGGWLYREFSVPGDRNQMGGILGIDMNSSGRKPTGLGDSSIDSGVDIGGEGIRREDTKVLLVSEDPRKAVASFATADAEELESGN